MERGIEYKSMPSVWLRFPFLFAAAAAAVEMMH